LHKVRYNASVTSEIVVNPDERGTRILTFTQLIMSRAFVREGDDQWLSDIAPTLNALTYYLTRQNNGVKVYLKKEGADPDGTTFYHMSDGLTYRLDKNGKWAAS
jgi:hypothetical protein